MMETFWSFAACVTALLIGKFVRALSVFQDVRSHGYSELNSRYRVVGHIEKRKDIDAEWERVK